MIARLWLPMLLGLALGPPDALPRQEAQQPQGFRLELSLTTLSGLPAIEVRVRNEGTKTTLVNKRFAYGGPGNPVAELTFEGQPPSPTGCRFNVRFADPTDYTLVGPGQFVGRTFRASVALCFVGAGEKVVLRARYLDHSQRGRKGPFLDEALVSNAITVPRQALRDAEQ